MEDNEKIAHLQKVLSSPTFQNSPTSSRLLEFLVTSTLEKKQLKETTVGIALFGEDYLNDPNTSRIRVNIYNLRKKLDAYYYEEGKNDAIKILINKGQYYTQFVKGAYVKAEVVDFKKKYRIVLGICLLSIIAVICLSIAHFYQPHINIWNKLLNNKKLTNVYVGDFFGIMGKTVTGKIGWNRDYEINSLAEFYAFKQEHAAAIDTPIIPSDYTYMTAMGAVGIKDLAQLFFSNNQDFTIRFSNKSSYEDIKERNTVYIGPIKNQNKFLALFNDKNPQLKFQKQQLHFQNFKQKKDTTFNLASNLSDGELAIVSRLPGDNNTEWFFFFSDHDIGVMATVDYFCNIQNLERFSTKHLGSTEYFTAIFFVKGKERTNLSLTLIDVTTNITQ